MTTFRDVECVLHDNIGGNPYDINARADRILDTFLQFLSDGKATMLPDVVYAIYSYSPLSANSECIGIYVSEELAKQECQKLGDTSYYERVNVLKVV